MEIRDYINVPSNLHYNYQYDEGNETNIGNETEYEYVFGRESKRDRNATAIYI